MKLLLAIIMMLTITSTYADCDSFGTYERRELCKGNCDAGTSYEIREVCKGNADAASTYELREAAKGNCDALSEYEEREACKSCSNKGKWVALSIAGGIVSCK